MKKLKSIIKYFQIKLKSVFNNSCKKESFLKSLNSKGEKYFPFISVLFMFILLSSLIGLIPYSFTITSHLLVTFNLIVFNFSKGESRHYSGV